MKTNNELIAEFMGFDKVIENGQFEVMEYNCEFPYERDGTIDDVKYHSSWDWLMPIVEKIDKLSPDIKMPDDLESLRNNTHPIDKYMEVTALPICTPIEDVYKAVVGFIQWYNQQKQ